MGFTLKNKDVILGTHKYSSGNTPVFKKDLGGKVMAEANKDGTIFIDKSLSDKEAALAVAHEKVHLDQMAQGKLNYTDDTVTWKKDTRSPARVYSRKEMAEGSKELPWENEAYDKQTQYYENNTNNTKS